MVPLDSDRVSRAPPYSRTVKTSRVLLTYATITRSGAAFQPASDKDSVFYLSPEFALKTDSRTTPNYATPQSLHVDGLGCSRFARHYYGNLG